jgi:hypothetical protein
MSGQHKTPMSLTQADMPLNMDMAKKFGYFFDGTGTSHIEHEEAAVVWLLFTLYVNCHKSMDVPAFNLPMEVCPGAPGGKEWLRRHVHTILSDPNYAGVQATPTGFAPGPHPPIISIELFNAAQQRRLRKTRIIEQKSRPSDFRLLNQKNRAVHNAHL